MIFNHWRGAIATDLIDTVMRFSLPCSPKIHSSPSFPRQIRAWKTVWSVRKFDVSSVPLRKGELQFAFSVTQQLSRADAATRQIKIAVRGSGYPCIVHRGAHLGHRHVL